MYVLPDEIVLRRLLTRLPLSSRTDCKQALFSAILPSSSLTSDPTSSSPRPSWAVSFLSPRPQSSGSKPSTFPASHCSASALNRLSPWSFYLPMFGVFVNLGLLYWKRHQHPLNLVLLSTFTLLESFTLGVLCAYFDNTIVLQALYVRLPPTLCAEP